MLRLQMACLAILVLLLVGAAVAQDDEFGEEPTGDDTTQAAEDEQGLPETMEEFEARVAEKALEPKQAVKLWFDAVFVYLNVDKELGAQMITLMTKDKEWQKKTYFMAALKERPYIFRSYAKDSSPDNDYEMNPNKYELVVEKTDRKPYADKEEDEYVKMFLKSSGADSARPIVFQRNIRGEYKVYEFSSIYVGIRPPKTQADAADDF